MIQVVTNSSNNNKCLIVSILANAHIINTKVLVSKYDFVFINEDFDIVNKNFDINNKLTLPIIQK